MSSELPLLFIAGLFGGMLNSIAGGGTFITFPALLFAGVPPISANATNTFASCSGYISGAYAFRKELQAHISELPKYLLISLFGGITGAWLLLQTPELIFREAIPWLLLFATLLFAFGSRLSDIFRQLASRHRHASSIGGVLLLLMLVGVCVYGGFFNAGLGINAELFGVGGSHKYQCHEWAEATDLYLCVIGSYCSVYLQWRNCVARREHCASWNNDGWLYCCSYFPSNFSGLRKKLCDPCWYQYYVVFFL